MSARVYGRDLRVGSRVLGQTVLALEPYRVPARLLHESVAEANPGGLDAWIATLSGPGRDYRITLFHDESYEVAS